MIVRMKQAIHEAVMSTSALRVDRKAGIIRGVKVLGLVSENGRKYTPEAVRKAASLYENIRVNIDHPEKDATQPRSAYDRFGKLTNIQYVEGEGLYGDLVFLRSHPMAERICEAAERMPDAFGMSHNAQGEGDEDKDGTFIVSKIVDVRHVDLVADPATTRSLSESKTFKEAKMDEKLKEAVDAMREAMAKLEYCMKEAYDAEAAEEGEGEEYDDKDAMEAEDGEPEEGEPDDSESDDTEEADDPKEKADTEEAEEADPEKAEKNAEEAMGKRLNFGDYEKQVSRMSDSEIDYALRDILATLKNADAMDREYGTDDGGYYRDQASVLRKEQAARRSGKKRATEAEDSENSYSEEDENKSPMEGKKAKSSKLAKLVEENKKLRSRERLRKFCESAGLKADRVLLEDLSSMAIDAAQRTIQRLALAQKATKPRSGSAFTESKGNDGIPSGDALFNWLAN